ncbi:MAG: exo-alpha-sialidase [Ignavibacteria bacterium]|nr:exo-alpha-sialidase [Ignavibacteria bacterium]
MNKIIIVILALAALVSHAHAQFWNLAVPQRAVFSIATNPLNPMSLIAGNYSRGFLSSHDAGSTWMELAVGELGGTSQITALVYHPKDTTVLLAGGIGFSGIDRSTDAGATWENVLTDPTGVRFEIASSGSIAFDPVDPDIIYVVRSSPPGVYRSEDVGATWEQHGTFPDLDASARMRAIAICPIQDSSHIMLATGRRAAIHRSSDGGKTWVSTEYKLGTHPFADGSQIRWSPIVRGRVYATSLVGNVGNGGLHYSDDYGLTWQLMKFQDSSLNALEVRATNNGDEIFVGGAEILGTSSGVRGDSIICRSPDGGNTWQDLSDVPWLENELGEVVANVWGFAVTQTTGPAEVFVATEVGAYRSNAVTSVRELQNTDNVLAIRGYGSNLVVASEVDDVITAVIYSIEGRELLRTQLHGRGKHRLDVSALQSGAYITSVFTTASRASSLIVR